MPEVRRRAQASPVPQPQDSRGRDPKVPLHVRLGRGPPVDLGVVVDVCEVLSLSGRVASLHPGSPQTLCGDRERQDEMCNGGLISCVARRVGPNHREPVRMTTWSSRSSDAL